MNLLKIAKLKIENFPRKKGGYAVIELLFYIAFFVLMSLAVLNSMIIMSRAYKETSIHNELVQAGGIMERISREVRQATGINTISPTSLVLNTVDSAGAGKIVEFSLSGT